MEMSKIKMALGLVAGASVALPMAAFAAADQEAAMKDNNNWALRVASMTTTAIPS